MSEIVKPFEYNEIDIVKAYRKSISFLNECSNEHGFLASITPHANYRRIWGRDGCITGLAAILSDEQDLIDKFRLTLNTLSQYQGKQGQIPSNVDPDKNIVSFGQTAGRVDATLWYVIGCCQFFKRTEDKKYIESKIDSLERAMGILEAWEFNQKDFIFVPDSGDWADETPRHGYILFDELLYYRAIQDFCDTKSELNMDVTELEAKKERLRKKIAVNFWAKNNNIDEEYIYHREMFENYSAKYMEKQEYWLEAFHGSVFHNRFDSFANILTILLDLSDKEQKLKIFDYISRIIGAGYLVPAFYPIVFPEDKEDWRKMKGSFSFYFKNNPYHSHNGGLWPLLTGFYIEALDRNGQKKLAEKYLKNIFYANSLDKEGEGWGFYEYHHGHRRTPHGTRGVSWNAGAGIMGYRILEGESIFI